MLISSPTFFHENSLSMLFEYSSECIAGVDEVGRGALAGPVCACATAIAPSAQQDVLRLGVRDSKMLCAAERSRIDQELRNHPGVFYGIGLVSQNDIDQMNIRRATFLAMRLALSSLLQKIPVRFLLVDGNECVPLLSVSQQSFVRGDARSATIACASILAKVYRDRLLIAAQQHYPKFSFARHKGYGTKLHHQELSSFGPTRYHRRSFLGRGGFLE